MAERNKYISYIDGSGIIDHIVSKAAKDSRMLLEHFQNFTQAWERRGLIGATDILLVNITLPPGEMNLPFGGHVYHGLTLLRSLRREMVEVPAIAFAFNKPEQAILDELKKLHASFVYRPNNPSALRQQFQQGIEQPHLPR